MKEEISKEIMANIREDAARLSTWSEDWIVNAARTAGKDLSRMRDLLDRIIRAQEFAAKGDAE